MECVGGRRERAFLELKDDDASRRDRGEASFTEIDIEKTAGLIAISRLRGKSLAEFPVRAWEAASVHRWKTRFCLLDSPPSQKTHLQPRPAIFAAWSWKSMVQYSNAFYAFAAAS